MDKAILNVAVGSVIGIVVGLVIVTGLFENKQETISKQDYYLSSLQYLEDIRNSNDIIVQQQAELFHCN